MFKTTLQMIDFYLAGFVLHQKLVDVTHAVDGAEDLVHKDGIQIVPCVFFYLIFCIGFYYVSFFLTIFLKTVNLKFLFRHVDLTIYI